MRRHFRIGDEVRLKAPRQTFGGYSFQDGGMVISVKHPRCYPSGYIICKFPLASGAWVQTMSLPKHLILLSKT